MIMILHIAEHFNFFSKADFLYVCKFFYNRFFKVHLRWKRYDRIKSQECTVSINLEEAADL